MKILVIEDEKLLADSIKTLLEGKGFEVEVAYDGETGAEYAELGIYDLLILDVMMPRKDGYTLVQEMREQGMDTPVLFLTARDSVSDRVKGLDLGGDDYLIKPFDFDELLARIRAMTRKHAGQRTNCFTAGDLALDAERRRVTRGGAEVQLLPKEYSILEYLLRNKGKVMSREQIEDRIWNYEYSGSSNNVDGYMSRLRKKIDGDRNEKLIHTVKGVGWTIREPEDGGGQG